MLRSHLDEEVKKEEDKGPALERIPQATGWRMVVLPYKGVDKTKGGLYLTDKAIEEQQLTLQNVLSKKYKTLH